VTLSPLGPVCLCCVRVWVMSQVVKLVLVAAVIAVVGATEVKGGVRYLCLGGSLTTMLGMPYVPVVDHRSFTLTLIIAADTEVKVDPGTSVIVNCTGLSPQRGYATLMLARMASNIPAANVEGDDLLHADAIRIDTPRKHNHTVFCTRHTACACSFVQNPSGCQRTRGCLCVRARACV
jgi:hypothetical protein